MARVDSGNPASAAYKGGVTSAGNRATIVEQMEHGFDRLRLERTVRSCRQFEKPALYGPVGEQCGMKMAGQALSAVQRAKEGAELRPWIGAGDASHDYCASHTCRSRQE